MSTIIICVLIGAAALVYNFYSDFDGEFIPLVSGAFLGGMLGLLAGLVIALVVASTGLGVSQSTRVDRGELASIANNSTISGSFYLGSGSIDGKQQFVYYAKTGTDSYVLKQAGAEISSIVEDGGTYFETQVQVVTVANPFALPIDSTTVQHITFHVPKGSVVNNYQLDPHSGTNN